MKKTIMVEKEVDIRFLYIKIPCHSKITPHDLPLRKGNIWEAKIYIDTGQILNWPQGQTGRLFEKVRDEGIYELFDIRMRSIVILGDSYVPNSLIPGEFGDYIDLEIDASGRITNWPSTPDLKDFFKFCFDDSGRITNWPMANNT